MNFEGEISIFMRGNQHSDAFSRGKLAFSCMLKGKNSILM